MSEDISKLTVIQLKQQLQDLGLDVRGTKNVLIDRLSNHLKSAAIMNAQNETLKTVQTALPTEPQCIAADSSTGADESKVKPEPSEDKKDEQSAMCEKVDAENEQLPEWEKTPVNNRLELSPEEQEDNKKEETNFILDAYNCDLNMLIQPDKLTAYPFSMGGFAYLWTGILTNYGITKGKVYYECHLLSNLPKHDEDSTFDYECLLRVGFSVQNKDFTLGEVKNSYGFGGSGKKSTCANFSDYGQKYTAGDTVTVCLDYDGDSCKISYRVNGTDHGVAFNEEGLAGRPLFPHIYSKNVCFRLNFGQGTMQFPLDEQWQPVNMLDQSCRVRSRVAPSKREDCEVIMLIGLPGAGKTTLAEKIQLESPDKQYNILGTNSIIDRMKVVGLTRKQNYGGRWEALIEKASICLHKLMAVACKRRRNYIIDQTNVFGGAQSRKIRNFREFKTRAIVVVPTEEVLATRIKQMNEVEGEKAPESTVQDMRKNFNIPKPKSEVAKSFFHQVEFAELPEQEARELVDREYKKIVPGATPAAGTKGPEKSNRAGRNKRRNKDNRRNSNGTGGTPANNTGNNSQKKPRTSDPRSRPNIFSPNPAGRNAHNNNQSRRPNDNFYGSFNQHMYPGSSWAGAPDSYAYQGYMTPQPWQGGFAASMYSQSSTGPMGGGRPRAPYGQPNSYGVPYPQMSNLGYQQMNNLGYGSPGQMASANAYNHGQVKRPRMQNNAAPMMGQGYGYNNNNMNMSSPNRFRR